MYNAIVHAHRQLKSVAMILTRAPTAPFAATQYRMCLLAVTKSNQPTCNLLQAIRDIMLDLAPTEAW